VLGNSSLTEARKNLFQTGPSSVSAARATCFQINLEPTSATSVGDLMSRMVNPLSLMSDLTWLTGTLSHLPFPAADTRSTERLTLRPRQGIPERNLSGRHLSPWAATSPRTC
jgi:hypothetical protein